MILRSLLKHRGLGVNLIAGFSFLMLAVYGCGLNWDALGGYLLLIVICLAGLIGFAAFLGWLLRKWMSRSKNPRPAINTDTKDDIKNQNDDSQDVKRD